MSVKSISSQLATTKNWVGSRASQTSTPIEWERPADWLALPTVLETDQIFVGLHAIYSDANFLALSAAGDYAVDWGDGVVENFASGVTAQHIYDYTTYDVSNATLCSRGYKQVIVAVTPQVGQNLTVLDLHKKHNMANLQKYNSGFLDIAIAGQYLTDLRIGVVTPGSSTQNILFGALERFNLVRSNVKQASNLLYNCRRLAEVGGLATSTDPTRSVNVTFQDAGDTATATGHGFINGDPVIFSSISSTTGVTEGIQYYVVGATVDTFQVSGSYGGAALALTTNGVGVASAGTSFFQMFNGCYSLQSVPLFNTAAGTNFTSMFNSCYSLQSVPLFNTAAGTSFTSMFQNCYSLQSVPLFNTAVGTNFSSMLIGCYSLQSVPLFNTAAGTNFTSMFNGCYSLQSVPLLNTAVGTNFNNMFNGCYSLQSVPRFNTAAGTNFVSMFLNCYSLANIDAIGFNVSFSVSNCKLSAAALNKIYTNLATVTGQTITVTGNYGTTSDDPTIATAKGWTVTG